MSNLKYLVFVYGTLKSKQPNHYWVTNSANGQSKFICSGETSDPYPLTIATRYNIPFMLQLPGIGHRVTGEIYNIDESMLSNLDILEGYPKYYTRQEIVINGDNGQDYQCWAYFLSKYPDDFLKNRQLISDYNSLRTEPYVLPHERPKSPKSMDDLNYRP